MDKRDVNDFDNDNSKDLMELGKKIARDITKQQELFLRLLILKEEQQEEEFRMVMKLHLIIIGLSLVYIVLITVKGGF